MYKEKWGNKIIFILYFKIFYHNNLLKLFIIF